MEVRGQSYVLEYINAVSVSQFCFAKCRVGRKEQNTFCATIRYKDRERMELGVLSSNNSLHDLWDGHVDSQDEDEKKHSTNVLLEGLGITTKWVLSYLE